VIADLRRVLGLWRGHAAALATGAAVAAISALAGIVLLAAAGLAVATDVTVGAVALGGALLVALRLLVVLRPGLRWAERMCTHNAAFRALADTRVWFFRRLAERLPAGLGLTRAGDVMGRLVADVESLDGLYLRALVPGAAAITVVLAIAVPLGVVPAAALAVGLPLAAALLLPLLLVRPAAQAAAQVAEAQGSLRAAAIDPLTGLEDTLSANAELRAGAVLASAGGTLMAAQRRLAWRGALGGAAGGLLVQGAVLGALAVGLAGAPIGAAVLGLFLAVAAAESLGMLPRAGAAIAAAAAGARRLFAVADTPIPVRDPVAPAALPEGSTIRFEDVHFAWAPDRPAVFCGLDLEIAEGSRVAILGPSGAGKSTLIALLLRLAAPSAGRITLGGVDTADLAAADIRHRVACLTQEARLFDDTIAANLRLAAPGAPDAALWRALDRAGIGALVRALPDGLATGCGEGGARFSGGQARRLALARALLSPAPVLVLDEPTAGLDAATARAFLETLEASTAGRTVVLVTHRLMGVERPGRIFRIVGGRVVVAAG